MKDILEIVGEYGLSIVREGEILRSQCPFHNDTGRPNFTVYKDTDSWFCFSCGIGGDVIDFVARIEGISKRAAMAKLRGDVDEWVERQEIIDGLLAEDEPEVKNVECDFLVSRLARQAMQQDPQKIPTTMEFLKDFDRKLQHPVTFKIMQEILQEAKQKCLASLTLSRRITMPDNDTKRVITITKRYSRTVSNDDYQSFGFETVLSETVEVSTREEFMAASEKLYNQAKGLTELDIDNSMADIQRSRKIPTTK